MSVDFDVIIIGSGAAGAHAAAELSERNHKIAVLDMGNIDDRYQSLIPSKSYVNIRQTDHTQRRFFLGEHFEGVPEDTTKPGSQLTPPRKFIVRDSEKLSKILMRNFNPVQSFAKGGLAEGWGGGVFEFNDYELKEANIDRTNMQYWYKKAADEIGVSAGIGDDLSQEFFPNISVQEGLPIDKNHTKIFESYNLRKNKFLRKHQFKMGRAPLAVLTRNHSLYADRKKNPLTNMDFYADPQKSFYKPSYTLCELEKSDKITYLPNLFVESFGKGKKNQERFVRGIDFKKNKPFEFSAKTIVLCAGALNSARIFLNSTKSENPLPLLCNPYFYIPTLNLSHLGGKVEEYKFSGAQLAGYFNSFWGESPVVTVLFSYDSLMLFRLVQQMPMPTWLGLQLARAIVTSLSIGLAHIPDKTHPENKIYFHDNQVHAKYGFENNAQVTKVVAKLKKIYKNLGLQPLGAPLNPGAGASIHYAGTLPSQGVSGFKAVTNKFGQLVSDSSVFVADSSTWTFLPAKGLTFTIMANSRRVASNVNKFLEQHRLEEVSNVQ